MKGRAHPIVSIEWRRTVNEWNCPVISDRFSYITLSHGNGGKLTHELIEIIFKKSFNNSYLNNAHDSAVLEIKNQRIAFTTDTYVINPIFFPGGDIGSLSINGTVNDLLMSGAEPFVISCGFVIEEGFLLSDLEKIACSMAEAAKAAHVNIVTGDTKVVEKGKADRIFINTSGVGIIKHNLDISAKSIKSGDKILISGDIGRHSIVILGEREKLTFESPIVSDTANLVVPVMALLKNVEVHCLRDLTRGGLATNICDLAKESGLNFEIYEKEIPITSVVQGVSEIMGYDPLYLANEGCFMAFLPEKDAHNALSILRSVGLSNSSIVGQVLDLGGRVFLENQVGSKRELMMLSGEMLPRIC